MAKSTKTSGGKVVQVTCRAPEAQHVFVAGTFNDWSTTATPLKKSDDGEWNTELQLLPGRYEYKLLVDGMWCCKPRCGDHAPGQPCADCVTNPFGTMNRVIEVK
jgi:1,4-alpha-glucan branching enzyme